jgi:hypothetical protein
MKMKFKKMYLLHFLIKKMQKYKMLVTFFPLSKNSTSQFWQFYVFLVLSDFEETF